MIDSEQNKIFAQNLSKYVNECGKMQIEIAKELNFPIQTFNGWCKGVSIPSMDKVQKLADYFHVGKTDLLDAKPYQAFAFSDEEKAIVEKYRTLSEPEKQMLKRMIGYSEAFKKLNEDK